MNTLSPEIEQAVREWAAQQSPIITAPNLRAAMVWLVQYDDLLPPTFGSYRRHYIHPELDGVHLRAREGTLLAVFYGYRDGGDSETYRRNLWVAGAVQNWTSRGHRAIEVELP